MKTSLKRKLYVHVILITAAIILFNRFAAQSLLHGQLMDQAWEDLSEAVVQCEPQLPEAIPFRHCAFDLQRDRITSMLTQDYAVCPVTGSNAAVDPACSRLQGLKTQWTSKEVDARGQRVELLKVDTPEGLWMGGRLKTPTDAFQVWLPESSVSHLRQRMWALRDRNLAYVLPFILTMLGLLTLWVAHLIMRPIRLLESKLSLVTSSNLGDTSNLEAPYVEFERIVSTFEDLRVRLRDSFSKARRFAADASHELRTPLTILRGNVEQLINQLPVGSDSQVHMRMIGDEVERLIDITEKLLLLSRADGNSMVKEESNFPISEFLEELVTDAQTFHPELDTRGEIEPRKVWPCDQHLIQQLIYNLYSNAVKYNVSNGWIHIGLKSDHDQWVLSFENPCADIPAELPKLAFDRFYRGNAAHSRKIDGLGLGLSLCQEIARLHGAQLTLSSPTGSTVLLRLVIPGKASLSE